MYFPGGNTHGVLIRCIASPQSLNERCGWLSSPDHVLLPLLLLNFKRKTRSQYTLFTINLINIYSTRQEVISINITCKVRETHLCTFIYYLFMKQYSVDKLKVRT